MRRTPAFTISISTSRRIVFAIAAACALAACGQGKGPAADPGRPVRIGSVEAIKFANNVQLSGEIQAQKNIALSFRIGGRVTERPVNVGDHVAAGQLVARLDPTTEKNALDAANAALVAARGALTTARNAFDRQDRLMRQGFTTRPRFDQAQQTLDAAQADLESAEAQVELARDRVGFTELRAGTAGVVVARSIEPGEVVQAGQAILQIARDDGRDAVFRVPANILERQADYEDVTIRVALADAPSVTASGRVREVSPQADPVTRTFQVRVGLIDPPEAMRLGSTVKGSMEVTSSAIVSIPPGALTVEGTSPAVWVVDPKTSVVQLRSIDILRFDAYSVIISQGLEPGEMIVTSGAQALHPGQRVRKIPAG